MTSMPAPAAFRDDGLSMTELVLVLSIAMLVLAMSWPVMASAISAGKGHQAAAFVAGQLRSAQSEALRASRAAGLVFDDTSGHWRFRVCVDGNGNGLRRADVVVGIDRCLTEAFDVATMFSGVAIGVDPGLRGPDGEPGSADPVRFGRGNIASFTGAGSGTAGSLFLRLNDGEHFLIRVAGVTGRVRLLRHHPATLRWEEL
jgi:type II secretory pathway pseudopilin PulG